MLEFGYCLKVSWLFCLLCFMSFRSLTGCEPKQNQPTVIEQKYVDQSENYTEINFMLTENEMASMILSFYKLQ